MLLEITSTFAGKVAFITHVAGTCIQTWKIFQGEISHFWIHFQNFKMGPLEDFEKKKVQGWENLFRVAKIGFWDHFPHWLGVYLVWKKVVLDFRLGHQECPNQKIRFKGFNFKILTKAQLQNFLPNFIFNDNIIQVLSVWVYIGMKMIALWSNRNCMRSANLNIFLYLGRKLTTCSQHLKMWSLILNFPSSWHANHNFD